MESVLDESKGNTGLHADGSVVACAAVSLSCFITSNVEGSQSGTRRTMGRGDPKMLLHYKLCSYSKVHIFQCIT